MKIEYASTNVRVGDPIQDIRELIKLANKRKSVVIKNSPKFILVRPASFIIGLPLRVVCQYKLFYAINEKPRRLRDLKPKSTEDKLKSGYFGTKISHNKPINTK